MNNYPILDLHCDTAWLMMDGRPLYSNDGMLSIEKMLKGGIFCQFFALYISLADFKTTQEGYEHLHDMYNNLIKELEANKEYIEIARTAEDIITLRGKGKMASIISLEEGGVLDGKLERLDELYSMGIRLITILWNNENSLGYPHSPNKAEMSRGLKPFGFEVVERMQELGMIIDVSHLSDGGFRDVARLCKKPFIASHSNSRELCGHTRNLTDEMLKTLAEAGGVTGINFYHSFLGDDETGSIEQMIAHAKHIHNAAGIDVLALGSDFDGFDGPCGLSDCAQFPILTDAFSKAGFSDGQIEKICWKNAMRVLNEIL